MTDLYDLKRSYELERRIERLERQLCERFGHDWPQAFHRLCGHDGADYYLRHCRMCGKSEHRTIEQGTGPTPRAVAQ